MNRTGENPHVLIVVPAYNEERVLASVLADVSAAAGEYDILVVDDGSQDDTASIARTSGAAVVSHPFNMGYGAAIQTGYKYAERHRYDALVQIDGDGQHDPRDIRALVGSVLSGHADVCVGSRFLRAARERAYQASPVRRLGMALFGTIAGWAAGRRVTDPTSGYQALSRGAFVYLRQDVFPSDYPDADVLILLHRVGFRVTESPVTMLPSRTGRSMHRGLRPLFYVCKMSLSILVTILGRPPASPVVHH